MARAGAAALHGGSVGEAVAGFLAGQGGILTLEDLAAEITAGCTTEKEKAMAVFQFVEKQTYWWTYPKDRTSSNPVRHFNIYGYRICSQAGRPC